MTQKDKGHRPLPVNRSKRHLFPRAQPNNNRRYPHASLYSRPTFVGAPGTVRAKCPEFTRTRGSVQAKGRYHGDVMFGILIPFCFASMASPPVDPINPDRPDVSDGAGITPKGKPIAELGYRQTQSSGVVIRQFGDSPLFRIGLTDNVELRLVPGGYTDFRIFGQSFTGWESSNVGFKWRFREAKKGQPAFALEGGTSLPTGSRFFREPALQPGLTAIVDMPIDAQNDLSVNLGYALLRDNGQQFGQTVVSASLGHQMAKSLGSFAELYTTLAPNSHGGDRLFADLGLTYLLTDNVQLDAFTGSTIDRKEHLFFFGAGVSFRF